VGHTPGAMIAPNYVLKGVCKDKNDVAGRE